MSIRLKDTANITAKSASSATKATKATQDSAGQQINTTYIKDLSVNGRTITYTKGDGSTGTITTQDTNTDTNTTYTLSKNGSTITLTGSDGKTTSVTDSNTTYSTGTTSTSGLTKLYTETGTATDGTMTQAAIKTALDGKAASSHTHGLLHDNFTAELANTTTDSGWSMINSNYNGHLLKSLRTNASAPAWILNDYSAGIAFGGADTKGVMSIAYKSPSVRFAGGNGTKPVWYFTLSGTSAKVYNMDSLAANTANTLASARTINGTSFNGSANITTANWGTARNISIADNDGTNTGTAVSVNGSANATLKLPATIKAALAGNATTATTLQTARTINGTNFNGSANITTANWGTARTITVGNTGKSVNGSGNVSWSLSEIGALPLAGGTLSGRLTADGRISAPTAGSSWTSGMTVTNATIGISTQQSTNTYHPVLAVKTSGNHVVNIGGNGDNFGFYGFKSGRTENGTDWSFKINVGTGEVSSTGKITAPTFVGALSGNASTATTLKTARTINGTSFNGSENITTANWGTARTITIGKTGKSVNGSENVSWSLSEIGAVPTTGGGMTGAFTMANNVAIRSKNVSELTTTDSNVTVASDTNMNMFLYNNSHNLHIGSGFNDKKVTQGSTYITAPEKGYFRTVSSTGSIYFQTAGTTRVTINSSGVKASTFTGALSGNASTATKLETARTIKVGNTGKTFDGSGGITFTLADIGIVSGTSAPNNDDGRPNGTVYFKYA